MTRGLRIAAAIAAALAGAGGTVSASAAASFADMFGEGCVSTTASSSTGVDVSMTCAAFGWTDATAAQATAGVLTFTVHFAATSAGCPPVDASAHVHYSDAGGTVDVSSSGDTWTYAGNDLATGAPLCQLTSPGPASVAATGAYAGMNGVTLYEAVIPGVSSLLAQNPDAGSTWVDIGVAAG